MIDTLLSLIAPHHCCGCGKVGSLLCDNCKYNIISEPESICLPCGRPCGVSGICNNCRVPYEKAWSVGKRQDTLQRLVGLYKFECAKALSHVLTSFYEKLSPSYLVMLCWCQFQLSRVTFVIVVMTIRCWLARSFAKSCGLQLSRALARSTHTKQRQATAVIRYAKVKVAFIVTESLILDVPSSLIENIMTKGATLKYAVSACKQVGASQVWVAIIARQTLD